MNHGVHILRPAMALIRNLHFFPPSLVLMSHATTLACKAFPFPYSFIKIARSHSEASPDKIKGKSMAESHHLSITKGQSISGEKICNGGLLKKTTTFLYDDCSIYLADYHSELCMIWSD